MKIPVASSSKALPRTAPRALSARDRGGHTPGKRAGDAQRQHAQQRGGLREGIAGRDDLASFREDYRVHGEPNRGPNGISDDYANDHTHHGQPFVAWTLAQASIGIRRPGMPFCAAMQVLARAQRPQLQLLLGLTPRGAVASLVTRPQNEPPAH